MARRAWPAVSGLLLTASERCAATMMTQKDVQSIAKWMGTSMKFGRTVTRISDTDARVRSASWPMMSEVRRWAG